MCYTEENEDSEQDTRGWEASRPPDARPVVVAIVKPHPLSQELTDQAASFF